MTVLLVFVDGIGLGTPGPHNPFDGAARGVLAPLAGRGVRPPAGWSLSPLDASLGVPGLPQSASGTATLLTGVNVPALLGEHLFGFPDRRVRPVLEERSVLRVARERHRLRTAYLNAFTPERVRGISEGGWRRAEGGGAAGDVAADEAHSRLRPPPSAGRQTLRSRSRAPFSLGACTCAALAGGGGLVTTERVREGRAATFDVTGEVARAHGADVPLVSEDHAARAVATGAREVDLALFELFLTDKAGHAQDTTWARAEVRRTEGFLHALTRHMDPARDLVLVVSDHGNLEDLSVRGHTYARVPALAWGRGAEEMVRGMTSLLDVAGAVLGAATRR